MRVLWICALPLQIQREMLGGVDHGAQVAMSWILAHLPPPPEVDLHIACLWPGGSRRKDLEYQGAHFHLVPCPRRGRALLLFVRDRRYFRGLVEELQPDLIHGWGTEDSFSLVARQLAPRRHLVGIQGLITAYRERVPMDVRSRLTALTERWTLRRARHVVAESHYSREAARPLCPQAALHIVEHPLRAEFLGAAAADGEARAMVFLGGINERKGITDALQAFAALDRPEWSLHVIGSGTPQEEERLAVLASRLLPGQFPRTAATFPARNSSPCSSRTRCCSCPRRSTPARRR